MFHATQIETFRTDNTQTSRFRSVDAKSKAYDTENNLKSFRSIENQTFMKMPVLKDAYLSQRIITQDKIDKSI